MRVSVCYTSSSHDIYHMQVENVWSDSSDEVMEVHARVKGSDIGCYLILKTFTAFRTDFIKCRYYHFH